MIGLIVMGGCVLVSAACLTWWVRDVVRSWRRQARHAARVITETEAEFAGGLARERGWTLPREQVVPYAPVEGHPPWPIGGNDPDDWHDEDEPWAWSGDEPFSAPPLSHPVWRNPRVTPDWREQTAADLSPEALDGEEAVLLASEAAIREAGEPWGTCDWGYCDEVSVAWREDPEHGRLPVCAAHANDSGPDVRGPSLAPPGPVQMNRLGTPIRTYLPPWPAHDERLPASLPAIERQFAETMSRLWADVHGWAAEPWAVRMPWEAAA